MGILLLSQVRLEGSTTPMYAWISADLTFSFGRLVLLLQPGALFASGILPLVVAGIFIMNSTAVLGGVVLHALSLMRVSGRFMSQRLVLVLSFGLPFIYMLVAM